MPIKNKERELVISSENLENLPDNNLLFSPNLHLQINEENPMDVYTLSTRNDPNLTSLFKSQINDVVDLTDAIFPNSADQVRYKSQDIDIENLKMHTFELYQLNLSLTQSRTDWFDRFLEIVFFIFSSTL